VSWEPGILSPARQPDARASDEIAKAMIEKGPARKGLPIFSPVGPHSDKRSEDLFPATVFGLYVI